MAKRAQTPSLSAVVSTVFFLIGIVFLAGAWLQYDRVQKAKGSAEKLEATIDGVSTFKKESVSGVIDLPFAPVKRATFTMGDASGTGITSSADAPRLFSWAGSLAAGDHATVYRSEATSEFILDIWPWNYGEAASSMSVGIILWAFAALFRSISGRRK